MAVILISIEDLSADNNGTNVDITCKRLAKPGEPDSTPATHLAEFVERAITAYIQNTNGSLMVASENASTCWH